MDLLIANLATLLLQSELADRFVQELIQFLLVTHFVLAELPILTPLPATLQLALPQMLGLIAQFTSTPMPPTELLQALH